LAELAGRHEIRNSLFKASYRRECRRYAPALGEDRPAATRGGHSCAGGASNGTLLHDFVIEETARMIHVLNSPSPAAIAALPIGQQLAQPAVSG
jgi:L-2-hydroxyglutarate oxidase